MLLKPLALLGLNLKVVIFLFLCMVAGLVGTCVPPLFFLAFGKPKILLALPVYQYGKAKELGK